MKSEEVMKRNNKLIIRCYLSVLSDTSNMNTNITLEMVTVTTNSSDNNTCLWEDNVTDTCLDFLAEEEKDYLYKVRLVQGIVIFKMFLGQNNHNTKINKRFEGSHESLFTEQFLYLSYKLFEPTNTRDEGRAPYRLEIFLLNLILKRGETRCDGDQCSPALDSPHY